MKETITAVAFVSRAAAWRLFFIVGDLSDAHPGHKNLLDLKFASTRTVDRRERQTMVAEQQDAP